MYTHSGTLIPLIYSYKHLIHSAAGMKGTNDNFYNLTYLFLSHFYRIKINERIIIRYMLNVNEDKIDCSLYYGLMLNRVS